MDIDKKSKIKNILEELNTDKVGSSGISFTSTLTIVFVILKLCNVIDWSWWWVLAPTWIPFLFVFIIFLIVLIVVSSTINNKDTNDKE